MLFGILSLLAFGAAFAGVSVRFGRPSAPRAGRTGRVPPAMDARRRPTIGPKRKFPLVTRERPLLDLGGLAGATRGRAIPIQNVNLTNSPSDESDPVWSPDGTKLLFSSNGEDTNNDGRIDAVRADETFHIWMMNPDGSGQRQITFGAGNQVQPAWSPNALRIAYASSEGGDYDIYLLTLTTGAFVRLSLGNSEERHPTWAAGGDKVAFTSDYQTGTTKIWSMKADGTLPQMLSATGPNEDFYPEWSPDGQTILFQSNGVDSDGNGKMDGASPDVNIWTMSYFGSQQRQLTAFVVPDFITSDKHPRWSRDGQFILFSSDRKDTDGNGTWDARGDFDVYYLPVNVPETPRTSSAVQLTQRSANEFNPLTDDEEMPTLFPAPYFYNPKVAFVTEQTGNRDIWITSLNDITDPRLMELPSVTPRQTIPGNTVTVTARIQDMESGVRSVYAQFRDPDDTVTDAEGVDHKVYYVQRDNPNPAVSPDFPIWTEVDCHMVDAANHTYRIPPYQPRADSLLDLPPDTGWLQLFDDGQHSDGAAGDGLYGNTWRTPARAPSDYIVDIIAYDNVGNWKIYDGVWGFTTQQFTATNGVLLVMDYAHGQKFMYGEHSQFIYEYNYFPMWFPIESYYTRNPTGMAVDTSVYANNIINIDMLGAPPAPYNLNIFYYAVDTFQRHLETESYDLWRVICRGRVTPDILAAYTPRYVPQPDLDNPYGAERMQLVADRCIFWASPYSGNLWVGEGTIVDTDTQVKLVDFLNKGGRLVVTGQDIAWALSRDGTASSPLLQRMGVEYSDDAPFWTVTGADPIPPLIIKRFGDDRLHAPGAGGVPNTHPGFGYWGEGAPQEPTTLHMPVYYLPVVWGAILSEVWLGSTSAREQGNICDTDAAGNQYWIDAVTPISPATAAYNYDPNNGVRNSTGNACIRKVDPDTGARSFFFAHGIEGVNREYADDNNLGDHCHNHRNHLVHNCICWLRTGTIYGMVQFTAGLGPAKDALVQIYQGNTVVGQARTREDGTYEVQGLPPANYRCIAILPGFSYDHVKTNTVHGAGRTEFNFRLSEAPPGSISGRVTEADATTPVEGATVTATLQGTYKGEQIEKAVQTDQFGAYIIPDLPTGLYQVRVSGEGFEDQTYATLVMVNPGADTPNINFTLGGVPGGITGTVTRESDGQPVTGATVELRSGTTLVAQTVTDNSGKFTFGNILAGTYEISVTGGAGILPTTVSVVVTANAQVRRNVVARTPPPAQVAGMVTDALGNPVSGATVEAVSSGTTVKTVASGDVQTEGSSKYNYKLTGLAAGIYEIKASKGGFTGGSVSVRLSESQQLFNVNFTLESLHVYSSGLTMVSSPFDYSEIDVANLLGLTTGSTKLASWVGTRYAYYPENPADRFRPGTGYFLLLGKPVALTREGRPTDSTKPATLKLTAGWNMIGNPFPFSVNWFDAKVLLGQQVLTLQEAISQDLIKNALWTYGNGQYRLAFQLMPWEGYWVKTTRDLTLQIPNVAARSATPDPYRTREVSEESWTLNLVATAGQYRDASNYAGTSRQAQDAYDVGTDVSEAPPTGMSGWVQLTFPHRQGWGREAGDYAVDVRSPVAREQVWDFEVNTSEPNTDVVVSWPDVGQLPRCYTAMLEDVDTGARRYLRSLGAYVFRSGNQGGARRFRLHITRQAQTRLSVTNLRMLPNRAGGATLSCDFSDAVSVRSEVRTASGRLVKEVAAGEARSPGVSSFFWDGRDQRGNGLGYGLYFWFVEASAEDGRSVKEFRPFIYVR